MLRAQPQRLLTVALLDEPAPAGAKQIEVGEDASNLAWVLSIHDWKHADVMLSHAICGHPQRLVRVGKDEVLAHDLRDERARAGVVCGLREVGEAHRAEQPA